METESGLNVVESIKTVQRAEPFTMAKESKRREGGSSVNSYGTQRQSSLILQEERASSLSSPQQQKPGLAKRDELRNEK